MSLVCVRDFEEKAQTAIDKNALDYYKSGAGDEFTLRLNRDAFQRLRIRPRFLKNVSKVDTNVKVLGVNLKWPIGISPTAMQKMAHPIGECGSARAAENVGCLFILSTLSTTAIEEISKQAPNAEKWFQLYIYKDRSLTQNLVRRAEKAGFKALVLTIDAPKFGARRADKRNKFTLPNHLGLANFTGECADGVKSMQGGSGINEYVSSQFDSTITWKDVECLIKYTNLPVIIKGVLTEEDALLSVHYGCHGIIVSNHGARQLDGVPASIEVLPEIVRAVGDKTVVMMDGGVRQGTDIFKAISLGAKIVFMGRPIIWGLGVNGQKGVEEVLDIVCKDFLLTMELAGCEKISDITPQMTVHESHYAKL